MITKLMLSSEDLAGVFSAILEYNRRGGLVGVTFHDATGSRVDVAYAEVYAEEKGLAVRALPEPDTPTLVHPPILDPRQIPGAASLEELNRLMGAGENGH